MADPLIADLGSDAFRDDLARALVSAFCREVAEQVEQDMPGAVSCPGQTFDPPCGGCPNCVYAQQTYHVHEPQAWHEFQTQAAHLIETVRGQMEFRARRVTDEGGPS